MSSCRNTSLVDQTWLSSQLLLKTKQNKTLKTEKIRCRKKINTTTKEKKGLNVSKIQKEPLSLNINKYFC